MIEGLLIGVGMVISYFLKDIQFLSLTFEFMNTGTIGPDFLLIFVIFFSLFRGEFVGLWVGFFSGLMEDGANWIMGSGPGDFLPIVGIHALVYSLAGFILGKMSHVFDRYQAAPIIALVFAAALLVRFFAWTIQGLVEDFNRNYSLVGPAVYTGLIAPIWFTFLGWLYRIKPADL